MKFALAVSLAVLVTINVAAHGQNGGAVAKAVTDTAAHPGTALLDSMGIFAGVPAKIVTTVHPGTAILDSAGVFAGVPTGIPIIDGDAQSTVSTVTLK